MFSELARYADSEFLTTHRTGWLWLDGGKKKVEFLAYAELDANLSDVYDMDMGRNGHNAQILRHFGLEDRSSHLLVLSTCSRRERGLRDVVVGEILEK